MRRIYMVKVSWGLALTLLLLALIATPVSANGRAARLPDATAVNANIYIPTASLQPLFQQKISQQVPGTFSSAIGGIVSKLPAQDQGWARQMATTLIQPSAVLTGLKPQTGGLATSLRISLYPGDPQPINASLLVSFSVANASTVQVSAKSLSGPSLVNGPLATFQIPIGQVNKVTATPGCGDSALSVNLQYPMTLAMNQSPSQPVLADIQQPTSMTKPASSVNAYVEIPATSLASLGASIGSLPISSNLSAQNIQVGVQGHNMVITSDIDLGSSFRIGVATTQVAPMASGGNLAVRILSTNLTVFQFFTFPYNSYNQQIQQTLNAKLNGALAGKFSVAQAAIGSNSHIPCAASNGLLLTGTTNIG